MDYYPIKKQVYDATIKLYEIGLIRLSAGNVSARVSDDLIAITPRARSYDILEPEDISIVDLNHNLVEGSFQPSSETPLHTSLYREYPEVGAVVHTHSVYSISFAASNKAIPILCVEALAGNCNSGIPVGRYVSPGSPLAGEVALETFHKYPGLKAMLLKNHGLLAIGSNVEAAWQTAYKVETAAQIAFQANLLGTPESLTTEQIEELYRVYANLKRNRS